ncbi:hypothetical protein SH449x_000982 [Pirellulaceae bacterium SH449]
MVLWLPIRVSHHARHLARTLVRVLEEKVDIALASLINSIEAVRCTEMFLSRKVLVSRILTIVILGWFVPTAASTMYGMPIDPPRLHEVQAPSGDAEIRGEFRGFPIQIRTTQRLAGAIDSVQWNGQEFIDSYDHGRQLQSASSFDAGQPNPFWSERFNPTEAGSSRDGTGDRSSSKLLSIEVESNRLRTAIEAAFWLAPGESSGGYSALNPAVRSQHVIAKDVKIGTEWNGRLLSNVIDYRVTFRIPEDEPHQFAQFEVLTGYMPPEFSEFWGFDFDSKNLVKLSDGPGEQSMPIVFSTSSGDHAMGCLCVASPAGNYNGPGYGRFRFREENVVKWNCVFRLSQADGIPHGEHSFRVLVPIGTREDVRLALQHLLDNLP